MNELIRNRLQRQRQLEREVKSLPTINNELRNLIQEYESQYGEIIINGERFIDQLPEQEEIQPRTVLIYTFQIINRLCLQFVQVYLCIDNEMIDFSTCTIHLVSFLFCIVFYWFSIFNLFFPLSIICNLDCPYFIYSNMN